MKVYRSRLQRMNVKIATPPPGGPGGGSISSAREFTLLLD